MKLIRPSYEILHVDDSALKLLELAGRTCYKSEDRIADGTAEPFVKRIVQDYKHESVIEHASITVKFVVDRGVTHELVRHRLCSFSQNGLVRGSLSGIAWESLVPTAGPIRSAELTEN